MRASPLRGEPQHYCAKNYPCHIDSQLEDDVRCSNHASKSCASVYGDRNWSSYGNLLKTLKSTKHLERVRSAEALLSSYPTGQILVQPPENSKTESVGLPMANQSLLHSGPAQSSYAAISAPDMSDPRSIFQPGQIPSNQMQSPSQRGGVVANWFSNLFTVIVALSTLGLSITFGYVVGGIRQPFKESKYSKEQYEEFMAISWLLFSLDLAVATLLSTILSFYREQAVASWRGPTKSKRLMIQWIATLSVALLFILTISAFVFLSLVVTAYTKAVGWVALGFTGLCGIGGFVAIIWQSPAVVTRPPYEQPSNGQT